MGEKRERSEGYGDISGIFFDILHNYFIAEDCDRTLETERQEREREK